MSAPKSSYKMPVFPFPSTCTYMHRGTEVKFTATVMDHMPVAVSQSKAQQEGCALPGDATTNQRFLSHFPCAASPLTYSGC